MTKVTIDALVAATPETAWSCWTDPAHITGWNFASDDWCCPWAKSDLRLGGAYSARMEAKDGSFGFEFGGKYEELETGKVIGLRMDDGRLARTTFAAEKGGVRVTTVFDAEDENPVEMQQEGWQSILNSFKSYAESR